MVGDVARQKLRGSIIGEIAMQHRMSFGANRDIFAGLQSTISDYRYRHEYILLTNSTNVVS